MAQPYLDRLQALSAGAGTSNASGIACRHFFSGAAAYFQGRIFMTLTPVGLALKPPEARRRAVMASGGGVLRYFPKAPIKRHYVVLPPAIRDDAAALRELIQASIA